MSEDTLRYNLCLLKLKPKLLYFTYIHELYFFSKIKVFEFSDWEFFLCQKILKVEAIRQEIVNIRNLNALCLKIIFAKKN